MMTPPRPGEPFVLMTCHGTIVQYVAAADRLIHGPIGLDSPVVELVSRGDEASLSWRNASSDHPLGRATPGSQHLTAMLVATPLSLQETEPRRVNLSLGGRYLCAEADGTLALSRDVASDWEHFLLLTGAEYALLLRILGNRWIDDQTGIILRPVLATAGAQPVVSFGEDAISIPDLLAAASNAERGPNALWLPVAGWKLRLFRLYRPLAYLVAYGDDAIFDCAAIAIRCLFEFGQWDGDVLLITDADHAAFAERLPEWMRARLLIAAAPANDVLDYTLRRYGIADCAQAWDYQPLLYIDTDVMCDRPLAPLLRALVASPLVHAFPEMPLASENDYYGVSLLHADSLPFSPGEPGFSSGIIGFRSVGEHRALFQAIMRSTLGLAATLGRRDAFEYYDQPFFNYAARKSGMVTGAVMQRFATIQFSHWPPLSAPLRKGLVHFAGGVGKARPKLEQMTDYAALLRKAAALP